MKRNSIIALVAIAALSLAAQAAELGTPLPCVTATDGTPVLTSQGDAVVTQQFFSLDAPSEWDGKSPNLDPSCQGFGC